MNKDQKRIFFINEQNNTKEDTKKRKPWKGETRVENPTPKGPKLQPTSDSRLSLEPMLAPTPACYEQYLIEGKVQTRLFQKV